MQRLKVDPTSLGLAVKEATYAHANAKASFSAYNITQALREFYGPGVEINHLDVREVVHSTMRNIPYYAADFTGQYVLYHPETVNKVVLELTTSSPFDDEDDDDWGDEDDDEWEESPVQSSWVKSLSYHKGKKAMRVYTLLGRAYEFNNITLDTFKTILTAESVGKVIGNLARARAQEQKA